MEPTGGVGFFDAQFRRQLSAGELALNPFEQLALPYLHGRVLDYGCGLGNLGVAAAERGCSVLALDASPTAIEHLRALATARSLPIHAECVDLRDHVAPPGFDVVVSIGLLMFFACADARRQLARLQAAVRPGGVALVNVLIEGTTFLDMFDQQPHCLFGIAELPRAFAGWTGLARVGAGLRRPARARQAFLDRGGAQATGQCLRSRRRRWPCPPRVARRATGPLAAPTSTRLPVNPGVQGSGQALAASGARSRTWRRPRRAVAPASR